MKNTSNNEGIIPFKVYRLSEAAEALQLDKRTIYGYIKNGKLPDKIIGGGYKFLGEDLLRFMGSASFSEVDKINS